jgi:soluble lytic murein transglycosylase-like protein
MEKRLKKTLARTLRWSNTCLKVVLTSVLFIPPVLALKYSAPRADKSGLLPVAAPVAKAQALENQPRETPRPKELVKIYSIVKSNRPAIADREAWKVSNVILDESARRDVDPMLVLAVIKVESGFHNRALSPMGARGIMQIMPETGKYLSEELFRVDGFKTREFMPHHLDDPILNIKLGVYYLEGLKRQFRNLSLALLAYNVGPSEMQNRLENNIQFSDQYASLVLDTYREYRNTKAPAF